MLLFILILIYSYSYSILITFDLVSFVSCVSFDLFGSSFLQSYFNFRGSSQYQLVGPPNKVRRGSLELGSVSPYVRTSVRLSGVFLRIGSLVFSDLLHEVRGP